MTPPLSEERVAQISARHAAVEGGGWYLAPEPFATPGTVRATIDGYPRTIAVMDFRGWKADENRQFVLRAHDDMGALLADRSLYRDRAELVARVSQLELALGAAVSELRSAAMHVDAGQQLDAARLRDGADELEQVQRGTSKAGGLL